MDLSAYLKKQNEGAVLHLKDPAGADWNKPDGTPVTITLAGNESALWRQGENFVADKRMNNSNQAKEISWADRRVDGPTLLAFVTRSWDGIPDVWNGSEKLECTRDNAIKLYSEFDFIRMQVDGFIGARKNFLPASS